MIPKQTAAPATTPRVTADQSVSFKKILVGTDFSPTSARALNCAATLARSYKSQVYLTHVIAIDERTAPNLVAEAREQFRASAREELRQLATSGQLWGVSHQELLEEGDLWAAIEALIHKEGIDLIVVGTHGRSVVEKLLIGSGAEQIFRQARVPVLTVGPSVAREPLYEIELKNILFATDFGPGAERQAAAAFSLAQEHRSRLTLLHVIPNPHPEKVSYSDRQAILHQLKELVPHSVEMHCLPVFRCECGSPVDKILQVSREINADLMVLGAKPRGSLAGHVPHTQAYRVVCGAACPVLTVKC